MAANLQDIPITRKGGRTRTRRVETDELQGEGSYIIIKRATVNEAQELRKIQTTRPPDVEGLDRDEAQELMDAFSEDLELRARTFLANFILEWNWMNDDDQIFPLPDVDHLDVFGDLTTDELSFIYVAIAGADQNNAQKKQVTKKR